jgi:hypothetical protein
MKKLKIHNGGTVPKSNKKSLEEKLEDTIWLNEKDKRTYND